MKKTADALVVDWSSTRTICPLLHPSLGRSQVGLPALQTPFVQRVSTPPSREERPPSRWISKKAICPQAGAAQPPARIEAIRNATSTQILAPQPLTLQSPGCRQVVEVRKLIPREMLQLVRRHSWRVVFFSDDDFRR